jgi:hypothetical protein
MRENIATLNKRLKELGYANKEITRHKGEYYLLHICKNNTPVPLYHCKDSFNMRNHLEANYKEEAQNA